MRKGGKKNMWVKYHATWTRENIQIIGKGSARSVPTWWEKGWEEKKVSLGVHAGQRTTECPSVFPLDGRLALFHFLAKCTYGHPKRALLQCGICCKRNTNTSVIILTRKHVDLLRVAYLLRTLNGIMMGSHINGGVSEKGGKFVERKAQGEIEKWDKCKRYPSIWCPRVTVLGIC